jgi:hypothetical protein
MDLLDLMAMSNGGGNNLTNPHGDITFKGLEYNPLDLRLITFINPSTTISPNIDIYTNFSATLPSLTHLGLKKVSKLELTV